eukprot:SAG22_NODE_9754_length_571_cov_1.510593_1_plen_130_part_10
MSVAEGVPDRLRRYLVAAAFQRAGYSKFKLLAKQATLLPVTPMVAELLLLLFARDASWLLPREGEDVCGVEVATGDDRTEVPFDYHFSAEDWQLLNTLRAQMSKQVGNYRQAKPPKRRKRRADRWGGGAE